MNVKEDVKEFVKKSGAIDVLHALSEGEKSFGELKRGLNPATLSNRLKEGISLGLIEQIVRREEKSLRPVVAYKLTKKGFEVFEKIKPVMDEYSKIKAEIEQLENEIKKKKERLKKLLDELDF